MILFKSASVLRANVINHYFPARLRLLFCHYRALILEYLFCFLLFLFYPLIYLFTHFISRSLYFLFCFLRWGLMYSDWPQTHYVLEDDLELLICMPLPARCSDNRLLTPAHPPTSLLSTFSLLHSLPWFPYSQSLSGLSATLAWNIQALCSGWFCFLLWFWSRAPSTNSNSPHTPYAHVLGLTGFHHHT